MRVDPPTQSPQSLQHSVRARIRTTTARCRERGWRPMVRTLERDRVTRLDDHGQRTRPKCLSKRAERRFLLRRPKHGELDTGVHIGNVHDERVCGTGTGAGGAREVHVSAPSVRACVPVRGRPLNSKILSTALSSSALAPSPYTVSASVADGGTTRGYAKLRQCASALPSQSASRPARTHARTSWERHKSACPQAAPRLLQPGLVRLQHCRHCAVVCVCRSGDGTCCRRLERNCWVIRASERYYWKPFHVK